MFIHFVSLLAAQSKGLIEKKRGFIVWYLLGAVAAIGVFYLIYFIFWNEIKGWFIDGH